MKSISTHKRKGLIAIFAVIILLVIDQIIKIEVKTSMCLHESIRITDWFYISFIENNGMAYGMTIINKLVLSLFRIVAISVLGVYIYRQIKKECQDILSCLLGIGACRCHRQSYRLHVLWADIQRLVTLLCIIHGSVWPWLCSIPYG